MTELSLLIALLLMLLSPGVALLSLSPLWQKWQGLQRLAVIIGLSLASYPLLFYLVSELNANLHLDVRSLSVLLLIGWGCAIFRLRKEIISLLDFTGLEWIALLLLGATLFTRFWLAWQNPYPAWVDAVHHTMLTQLVAESGRIPPTLEPFFPVPLTMYHLGLHVNAAVTAWLANAPYHSALLWTAQALNGLCGLGVYFVLDRKAGRVAALTGLAVAGLFSYHPAFYVNWGRFTQVGSQALLLIAWLVTYEAVVAWRQYRQPLTSRYELVWLVLLSALLNAGLLLIHFRVAVIYGLLLAPSLVYALWQARRQRQEWQGMFVGIVSIGVAALVLIVPSLIPALRSYVSLTTGASPSALSITEIEQIMRQYFEGSTEALLQLATQSWLLYLAGVAIVIGLWRRSKVVMLSVVWVVLLWGLGNTYHLGIWLLNLTNLAGVVIMFYLPISLIIGAASQVLLDLLPGSPGRLLSRLYLTALLLLALPAGWQRIQQVEPFRYLVTPADLSAMEWIRSNTPPDAQFVVNTDFWVPSMPHGTDAGYWIPYFTLRKITAAPMLGNLADHDFQNRFIIQSRLVTSLASDLTALAALKAEGIDYIFIGARGNYTGKGLNAEQLRQSGLVKVLYEQEGVAIYQIL